MNAQTSGKIYAQALVDHALVKHPEVVVMAMHATPPDKKDNIIIASNIGRTGKLGDEEWYACNSHRKSNLEVSSKGDHFEVELVLQDKPGRTIGAIGIVFNYKPGDDKNAFDKKAEQIRNELREQIPALSKLFEPTCWDQTMKSHISRKSLERFSPVGWCKH
jgi:hypothetical protein